MQRVSMLKVMLSCLIVFGFIGCVGFAGLSYAQNKSQAEASSKSSDQKDGDFDIKKIPSLFFTYWQHQAILDAKNSRGVVRPPTQAELEAMENGEDFKPDPGIREISLGGIVYKGDKDWTIWLNGQRVTPVAVPKEVLDLRVYEEHVEVKWLDEYTNKVFPIRLKAHQRFNLDTRIFLSGN